MDLFSKDDGSFAGLTPKASFIAGLATGILVLCTIGFFVLLVMMFSGKSFAAKSGSAVKPTPTVTTPTPSAGGTEEVGDVKPVSDRDHIRGSNDATVTLIEYSDFECPFCQRFHPTMEQLMTEYEGKVRWVYRHFPLSFHQNAQKEAEASECVAELAGNDAFWEFTDKIYERTTANGTGFALEKLPDLAAEVGADRGKFEECLNSGKYASYVEEDMQSGVAAGVTGTPGTIAINDAGEAQLIPGAVSYSELKNVVDSLLQ